MESELLLSHLIHDHGRAGHEIAGIPLAHLHELEHLEDNLGLLDLQHQHAG